jgi:hypothetical protein
MHNGIVRGLIHETYKSRPSNRILKIPHFYGPEWAGYVQNCFHLLYTEGVNSVYIKIVKLLVAIFFPFYFQCNLIATLKWKRKWRIVLQPYVQKVTDM